MKLKEKLYMFGLYLVYFPVLVIWWPLNVLVLMLSRELIEVMNKHEEE